MDGGFGVAVWGVLDGSVRSAVDGKALVEGGRGKVESFFSGECSGESAGFGGSLVGDFLK